MTSVQDYSNYFRNINNNIGLILNFFISNWVHSGRDNCIFMLVTMIFSTIEMTQKHKVSEHLYWLPA